ncbi:MAG: hypothetical protein HY323_18550 [Betaproteobacteria bacterium]|nr:hypothetical protein [Betaproteobacteria bacterium]
MLRSLEKQFEPKKAARLKRLVERLSQFSFPPGASRYYGLELASCIQAGALLGALVVGSSLLELYVRALVVNHSHTVRQSIAPRKKSLEGTLEDNRKVGFEELIDNLALVGLFEKADSESAKALYKNVRIPLLHGLSRRFVRQHQEPFAEDLALLLGRETISSSELEAIIEDHALEYLENIVGIIERNRF